MRFKGLSIFLILVLGAIGAFGLWGTGLMDHGGGNACPIFAMFGGDCSSIHGTVALAVHHLSGLQFFTQSIISSDSIVVTLSVLLLAFSLLVSLSLFQQIFSQERFSYQKHRFYIEAEFRSRKDFLRWLASCEHSPTAFMSA